MCASNESATNSLGTLSNYAATTTTREITAQPEYNHDPAEPLAVDIPQPTEYHHWGKEKIGDDSDIQEPTLDRWKQPAIDTTEEDR